VYLGDNGHAFHALLFQKATKPPREVNSEIVSLFIVKRAPPLEVNLKAALALHYTSTGICLKRSARSLLKLHKKTRKILC